MEEQDKEARQYEALQGKIGNGRTGQGWRKKGGVGGRGTRKGRMVQGGVGKGEALKGRAGRGGEVIEMGKL